MQPLQGARALTQRESIARLIGGASITLGIHPAQVVEIPSSGATILVYRTSTEAIKMYQALDDANYSGVISDIEHDIKMLDALTLYAR